MDISPVQSSTKEVALIRKSVQLSSQTDRYDNLQPLIESLRTRKDICYTIYSTKENNPLYIGQRNGIIIVAGNGRMHFYGDESEVDNTANGVMRIINGSREIKGLCPVKSRDITQEEIGSLFGIERETLDSLISLTESDKYISLREAIRKVIE